MKKPLTYFIGAFQKRSWYGSLRKETKNDMERNLSFRSANHFWYKIIAFPPLSLPDLKVFTSTSLSKKGLSQASLNTSLLASFFLTFTGMLSPSQAQDWAGIPVPADPGNGKQWKLQADMSDDFNYDFPANNQETFIAGKWKNFWHNSWDGPGPTQWRHENVSVSNGHMNIVASRNGDTKTFRNSHDGTYHTLPATQMGCVVSKGHVQYPVFVEARVKIADAVFANNVWMISDDDYEEIDICENYGGLGDSGRTGTAMNAWFAKHIHLSHHVFNNRHLTNFDDYQPRDEEGVYGTWYYENGRTDWAGEYSTIGVYWKDPNHLEYYINGKWVRTLSGKNYAYLDPDGKLIEASADFNILDKYDYTNGKGLTKPMKLIINIEAQDWNALAGRYPTDGEIYGRPEDHIMKVDWIRVYTPEVVTGEAAIEIEAETFNATGGTFNDSAFGGPGYGVKNSGSIIDYNNDGDWVEYFVNIPEEGTYEINYLVATPSADSQIDFIVSNTYFNSTNLPYTGGYNNYQSVKASKNANFTAGNHLIRLTNQGASWGPNMDKFSLKRVGPMNSRSFSEDIYNMEYTLAPNPNEGIFTIHDPMGNGEAKDLRVMDQQGRIVLRQTLNCRQPIEINLKNQPTGVYYVKLGQQKTKKIILQ
ncbi:carbohydrate-binding protein [Persicobacter diffluens]|uniref:Beta-agarase n=1 Tax=Persicobacter diffluens TaxID=981 RepID=A0AAN4VXS5_9BACT|nr:hypothetical protein PEDI_14550 [Persicobacter diffluens]